jgi:hypothetical protein
VFSRVMDEFSGVCGAWIRVFLFLTISVSVLLAVVLRGCFVFEDYLNECWF